jgi:hypothetical protein
MFKSILICVLTALLSLAMVADSTQAVPDRPDIIVILTDGKRADDWPVLAKTTQLVAGAWYPNFVYTMPLCFRQENIGQQLEGRGTTTNDRMTTIKLR